MDMLYIHTYTYTRIHLMLITCGQVRCSGLGRGLTRAYAGEDAQFTIESKDINRNKTTSGEGCILCGVGRRV